MHAARIVPNQAPKAVAQFVLYPAIDLRHGRVVQLAPGADRRVAQERPSPEAQARAFEEAGSRWLHVVDLDAAFGERNQWTQLSRLLSDRRSRIQFGGGVRHMTDVQQLLDLGVERVVVGTQAVRNPLWLRELCRIFPRRIVVALDARQRELVVEGWTEETGIDAVAMARDLDNAGLLAILFTDVEGRPSMELVAELRVATPQTPLVVAMPEATLESLDRMAAAGVDGVVLGRSLYEGDLDLVAALDKYPSPPAHWPLAVVSAREEFVRDGGDGA